MKQWLSALRAMEPERNDVGTVAVQAPHLVSRILASVVAQLGK